MSKDRIAPKTEAQVQPQDPIGVIAGETTRAADDRSLFGLVAESSFEMAWALAH